MCRNYAEYPDYTAIIYSHDAYFREHGGYQG